MSSNNKKKEKTKPKEPELRPKVYIVGGGYECIALMYRLGCNGAKSVDGADIVLFTGGEDVDPRLYKEVPLAKTHFNRARDDKELAIFDEALQKGIPMVGICRGGQFLNVASGGSMWQHVNGHTGTHIARVEIPPFRNGNKRRIISVTSTHHQMMRPSKDATILCTAQECSDKMSPAYNKIGKDPKDPDIEVVFYEDTGCLCFQPHPEFGTAPADCVDFFEECLEKYIYPRVKEKKGK